MSESANEKKYEATERRLLELKKQGKFLRSRDYVSFIILLSYILLIFYFFKSFFVHFNNNFYHAISLFKSSAFELNLSQLIFLFGLSDLKMLSMMFLFAFAAVLTGMSVFGGLHFSFESIRFNFNRLNFIENLARIFSMNVFFEIFKSFFKASLIIAALVFFIKSQSTKIFHLLTLDLNTSLISIHFILLHFVYVLIIASAFIALIDMLYQFRQFNQDSRMSLQEIKDEQKESETRPEVKNKIRMRQILLLKQQLTTIIPTATVVVVNPIHFAVVLRYQEGKDRAPRVIAKGQNEIVDHIKLLANKHGVPIFSFPTLARAIYHTAKVGDEIKPELYTAVALVLSYLYQLKNYQIGKAPMPRPIENLHIPPEFSHY